MWANPLAECTIRPRLYHPPEETAPVRLSCVYRLVTIVFAVIYVLLTYPTFTGSFGFCFGGL